MTIQHLAVPAAVGRTAYVLKLIPHGTQALLSLPHRTMSIHPQVRAWPRRDRRSAYKIERELPVLPLSRGIGRIEQFKRQLLVYRSVIGQPRKQELLEFLLSNLSQEEIQ